MLKPSPKKQQKLQAGIDNHKNDLRNLLKEKQPLEAVSEVLIRDLLENAFGYPKKCIKVQARVGKNRVDMLLEGNTKKGIICECKRYNARRSELDKKSTHHQLQDYCEEQDTEWGILTDAIRWEFYRYDKRQRRLKIIFKADFLDILERNVNKSYCEKFYAFHSTIKEKMRKDYALKQEILSQENIYRLLRSEAVLAAIYNQIHQTEKGRKYWQTALQKKINELFPIKGRKPYQRKKKQNKKQEETK